MRSGGCPLTSHMWGHFLLCGVCVRRDQAPTSHKGKGRGEGEGEGSTHLRCREEDVEEVGARGPSGWGELLKPLSPS